MQEVSIYPGSPYSELDKVEEANHVLTTTEIERRLAAGEPVYVSFMDKRRAGSVGRLVSVTFESGRRNGYNRRMYRYSDYNFYEVKDLVVQWDDRKNVVKPDPRDIKWLRDRPNDAGTVWAWDPSVTAKPKPEPKIVNDTLGDPIAAGEFVCFVERRWKNISLRFGTVTRMTPAGTVFVKTLQLKDGDRSEEVRCLQNELVIVNNSLMSRLVMARMRAE